MKKTCKGCKALEHDNYCGLSKQNKSIYMGHIVVDNIPLEECPKPKTNSLYFKLKNQ